MKRAGLYIISGRHFISLKLIFAYLNKCINNLLLVFFACYLSRDLLKNHYKKEKYFLSINKWPQDEEPREKEQLAILKAKNGLIFK
jgi:hypothetical protein